jgi:hypothetical protein
MLPLGKRRLFNALKSQLHINDNPHSLESQKFSWNNLREDRARILARLDRLYLFEESETRPQKLLSYRICGGTTGLDHLPLETSIQLKDRVGHKSRWHMFTYWLEEAAPKLKELWQAQPHTNSFFSKI